MACLVTVRDLSELRAYVGGAEAIYVNGFQVSASPSSSYGLYVRDDLDGASVDNGNSVIVGSGSKRWKLATGTIAERSQQFTAGYGSVWTLSAVVATVTKVFMDGRFFDLRNFSISATVVAANFTVSPTYKVIDIVYI